MADLNALSRMCLEDRETTKRLSGDCAADIRTGYSRASPLEPTWSVYVHFLVVAFLTKEFHEINP